MTHSPATEVKVATSANARAMPINIGSPFRKNDGPALAKTKGITGNIERLTMVKTPPRLSQHEHDRIPVCQGCDG